VSKYECKYECEDKVQCSTKYEYKCTDFKRQECENVWQNVCNGKKRRNKRSLSESSQSDEQISVPGSSQRSDHARGLAGPEGPPVVNSDEVVLSRVKRLIPTEVVYDQSYPLPPSDIPFASETAGQIFTFASPPLSKSCWRQVRKCEWKKYRSQCRNVPTKKCDSTASKVCKNKCDRVYYCFKCPSGSAITTTPKPKPKPVVGPPSPPLPGTFIVRPPAPPNRFDSVIDAKKQSRDGNGGSRRGNRNQRQNSNSRRRRP
jgi:hypothetical protein